MNTDRLMTLALEMAGLTDIPGDSAIYHPGDGIKKVMFGIDIKSPELKIAVDMGFDAAVACKRRPTNCQQPARLPISSLTFMSHLANSVTRLPRSNYEWGSRITPSARS